MTGWSGKSGETACSTQWQDRADAVPASSPVPGMRLVVRCLACGVPSPL
jgi:hypothetical protein